MSSSSFSSCREREFAGMPGRKMDGGAYEFEEGRLGMM